MEDASLERKKEIARGWGGQNFRIFKCVIKSIPGAESDQIWRHAKFLDSDEGVGAEYFDWIRFDYFLERGRVLLNTFAEFKRMLSEGIEEEEARRRAQEGE